MSEAVTGQDQAAAVMRSMLKRVNPSFVDLGEFMCANCREPRLAGQAITPFMCCDCGERYSWGNNAAPKRCRICADLHNLCMRCDNELDTYA